MSGFDVSVDFVEWGILGILPGKQEALPSAGRWAHRSFCPCSGPAASKQCHLSSQLQGVQISLLLQDQDNSRCSWSACLERLQATLPANTNWLV